jgi:hypothetical protein
MTAETVREIARFAFIDAVEIKGIIEVLRAGNDKTIIRGLNEGGAGRAAAHVTRALFTRLHLLVARAYGRTRRKDRHVRKAFEILKDPKISAEMQNPADLNEATRRWEKCCGGI